MCDFVSYYLSLCSFYRAMRSLERIVATYCHDLRPIVCPSVCPSVCLGRACIVIIRCTLVRISVYGWIVQCSGKACPPTPSPLFPVPPGREVGYRYGGMDVQTRRDISRTVQDRVKLPLSDTKKSYMPRRLAQQRMTLSDL